MNSNELFKSSTIMATGTIVSRVTGLIRGLLLVAVLGTTLLGDTFNVANTMPNILYNLIIGGALTAVFVPQIVRSTKEQDGGNLFISRLITATAVFLGLLVLLSTLFAPLLVRIFATSYIGHPAFNVTTSFMRFCLPQIFFMGLFALLSQVANAKGLFGPMMWAPVLNNLIAIAVFGWYYNKQLTHTVENIPTSEIIALGLGTTLGYVVQALVLIPVIRKTKIKITPRFDWRDAEIKKSIRLAGWTFLFAAISQLSYLITVNLSTSAAFKAIKDGVTTGVGFTPYNNALLIFMFPHSIITISIVTALLPTFSKLAHENRTTELHYQLVRAMRLVGIIIVPSSIAFLFFGPLITRTLFFGISPADGNYLGYVLCALALGLAPMSANLIALRGINAFENVRLQVISNGLMNLIAIIISISLAAILPHKWVTIGLAGALSFSYYIGAWSSLWLLRRFEIKIRTAEVVGFYLKLAFLTLIVAIPTFFIQSHIPGGNTLRLIEVFVLCGAGYLLLARLAKVEEVKSLFKLTIRKSN